MFSKFIRFFVAFLMMLSPSLPHFFGLPAIPKGPDVNMDKFELVWSDEFSGNELDMTKWSYNWWELERKGGFWHEDMVDVKDGNLVITTAYYENGLPLPEAYKSYFEEHPTDKQYKPGWYTGVVETRHKFEQCYGYFECRAILPASAGMWSAFWMMNEGVFNVDGSGKDGTEVDIFESMYYKDNAFGYGDAVLSGIHFDGYGDGHKSDNIGKWFCNNPYEEYNTYGLEWNENEYINGVETGRLSTGGVSQNPEYLILSCEIAGANGIPDTDSLGTSKISMKPGDTAQFVVDYVRVYQYK